MNTNKKAIGDRIQEIRLQRSISVQELADNIDVNTSAIYMYERGERLPKAETLQKLCVYLNVSADYILNLSDNKVRESQRKADNSVQEKYNALDSFGKKAIDTLMTVEHERCTVPEPQRMIPIWHSYNTVSAGAGEWLEDAGGKEEMYPDCPSARRADEVITISGDSMEPLFYDGDEVYVKRTNEVPTGKIGIFIYNGDGYIKRAQYDRLESLNKNRPDIYIEDDIDCKAYGLVIGRVEWEDDED